MRRLAVTQFKHDRPACNRNCKSNGQRCIHPKKNAALDDFETVSWLSTLSRYPMIDILSMDGMLKLARLRQQLVSN